MANICTNEIYVSGTERIINFVFKVIEAYFDNDLEINSEELTGYFYSNWVIPMDVMEDLLYNLNKINEEFYIRVFSYELGNYYHALYWADNETKKWIEE